MHKPLLLLLWLPLNHSSMLLNWRCNGKMLMQAIYEMVLWLRLLYIGRSLRDARLLILHRIVRMLLHALHQRGDWLLLLSIRHSPQRSAAAEQLAGLVDADMMADKEGHECCLDAGHELAVGLLDGSAAAAGMHWATCQQCKGMHVGLYEPYMAVAAVWAAYQAAHKPCARSFRGLHGQCLTAALAVGPEQFDSHQPWVGGIAC